MSSNSQVIITTHKTMSCIDNFDNMSFEERLTMLDNITKGMIKSVDKMFKRNYVYILD